MHSVPDFYAVYLLRLEPRPRSFYVGSTPDPWRRVRQHNGDLASGAYRTKRAGSRPWHAAAVVHSFPSRVAALQFEHALQHPHTSRHIVKDGTTRSRGKGAASLHQRLASVRLLVRAPYFDRFDLKVVLFSDEVAVAWNKNKYNGPEMPYYQADFTHYFHQKDADSLCVYSIARKEQQLLTAAKKALFCNPNCCICSQQIDFIEQEKLVAVCPDCSVPYHLTCWGRNCNDLVPKSALCLECGDESSWYTIAKMATQLRAYVKAGGKSEEQKEEGEEETE